MEDSFREACSKTLFDQEGLFLRDLVKIADIKGLYSCWAQDRENQNFHAILNRVRDSDDLPEILNIDQFIDDCCYSYIDMTANSRVFLVLNEIFETQVEKVKIHYKEGPSHVWNVTEGLVPRHLICSKKTHKHYHKKYLFDDMSYSALNCEFLINGEWKKSLNKMCMLPETAEKIILQFVFKEHMRFIIDVDLPKEREAKDANEFLKEVAFDFFLNSYESKEMSLDVLKNFLKISHFKLKELKETLSEEEFKDIETDYDYAEYVFKDHFWDEEIAREVKLFCYKEGLDYNPPLDI